VRAGADPQAADAEGHAPADLWRPHPSACAVDSPLPPPGDYVGTYDLGGGHGILVEAAGDTLTVREFAPDRLVPVGPDRFACVAEPWTLAFDRDATGRVAGVEVAYLRRTVTAPRTAAPAYVGADACRQCHHEAWIVWSRSAHAHAQWRLTTGWARELGRARPRYADLVDPAADPRCVQCHRTGATDPDHVRLAGRDPAEGVGCEACHGPGSRHVAAGEPTPGARGCGQCHRRNFARDEAWPAIAHGG
jgi:hypothetical protein